MILSQKDNEVWETHPSDSKKDMLTCQRIFLAYNIDASYYCMCGKIKRKILRVQYNEWYAKGSN
jgi:hypothetical protein